MKVSVYIEDFETYIEDQAVRLTVCADVTIVKALVGHPFGVKMDESVGCIVVTEIHAEYWDRVFERWAPTSVNKRIILDDCLDLYAAIVRKAMQ